MHTYVLKLFIDDNSSAIVTVVQSNIFTRQRTLEEGVTGIETDLTCPFSRNIKIAINKRYCCIL